MSDDTLAAAETQNASGPPPQPLTDERTPGQLLADRCAFLRSLVARFIAGSAPPGPVDPEAAQLVLAVGTSPAPQNLTGWIVLAAAVLALWRHYFGQVKPADQALAHTLAQVQQSMAGTHILGRLAEQAPEELTEAAFDAILDGHQSKELARLGVRPYDVIPLVIAIRAAGTLLAQPRTESVVAENPMAKYLAFLKALLQFRDKLPRIFDWINEGLALFGELFALPPASGDDSLAMLAPDADASEVLAAEAQVAELLTPAGAQAAFDGSRLRALFKFLQDSGLLNVLIGAAAKAAAGGA